ncbi:MAG: hypothetical protein VW741_00950 [Flammeovirgaceae bacterium]
MQKYIIIFFLILSNNLLSQSSIYNKIGKNRIQYESFDWEVIYSNNFEIYYNTNSLYIAEIVSKHLENNFSSLTNNVGHRPFQKTKIFIYNSERDLEQSNIGINETDKFLSTNLNLNNRIVFKIAFNNNLHEFKEELNYEFCKVLISDLMHGNMSFAKRFGKVSFINIPEWFSKGAARYLAFGWDIEMDNIIRDYFLTENKKSLNKISEDQAGYIGQSIWNYISITYGKNTISNIINLTKLLRNPEKAISSSLGINFNNLIDNWSNFYLSNINSFERSYNESNFESLDKYDNIIDLKLDEGNNYILFSSIKNNYKKLVLLNRNSKKYKVIDKSKNNSNKESYFFKWIDSENISYLKDIKGIQYLISQNIISNKKTYKSLNRFDEIHGYSFNTNRNLIALSGTENNQSDIYLLGVKSDNIKKITDDLAHDIFPEFLQNSTSIVFSSNRANKDLTIKEANQTSDYNIYLYNLDTTSNNLTQLTKNESDNIKAKSISKSGILFLSDNKGIFNLYKLNIGSKPKQLTSNSTNIINYDFNSDKNNSFLAFNSLVEGKNIIIKENNFITDTEKISESTSRKKKLLSQKITQNKLKEISIQKKRNEIDFETTEDFNFEDDKIITSSILKNIERKRNSRINSNSKYRYSFVKNNFNSFIKVDQQEGLGTQVETDFIELFEDHKIYASAFLPFSSLKSSDLYTEYSYLKNRFDLRVSLDRKILFTEDSERFIYHKYLYNQLNFNISYPISKFSRFEIVPFLAIYKYNDLDYRIFNSTPPSFSFYEKNKFHGYNINFKFDNTNKLQSNLEEGTRIEFTFKNHISKNKNFKNLILDISHHQPVTDDIVLSSRLFYGNSFGENPNKYLLGGVNNSLINNIDNKGINDPLLISNGYNNYNYIFGEYIDLRGYNFNKFDGYKVLVLNSELRAPVVKALAGGSVSSSFLNSLQIAGFFDLGSSWNINSPFSSKSDVNTWIIKEPGSVFQAEIENSKNPWLASYGLSIRSFISDYYVKIDLAKPIEDYQIKSTKFHISFGYSF